MQFLITSNYKLNKLIKIKEMDKKIHRACLINSVAHLILLKVVP